MAGALFLLHFTSFKDLMQFFMAILSSHTHLHFITAHPPLFPYIQAPVETSGLFSRRQNAIRLQADFVSDKPGI
jgi:hypothetical protein